MYKKLYTFQSIFKFYPFMSTSSPNNQYPKIEATSLKDIPPLHDLTNLSHSDIKSILDFIDFPPLNLKKGEKCELLQIKEVLFKLNNNQTVILLEELIESVDRINNLKKLEKECDVLEISLANIKVEYDEISSLKKQDLETELLSLNHAFNDKQFETKHYHLLNQAYAFINQEPVNKNILNMFYFVKKNDKYEKIIEKCALIRQMERSNNLLAKLFLDLICQYTLKIEDIERKYKLDQVTLLKIVYGMTNNGIVSYDKERGIITFRK